MADDAASFRSTTSQRQPVNREWTMSESERKVDQLSSSARDQRRHADGHAAAQVLASGRPVG